MNKFKKLRVVNNWYNFTFYLGDKLLTELDTKIDVMFPDGIVETHTLVWKEVMNVYHGGGIEQRTYSTAPHIKIKYHDFECIIDFSKQSLDHLKFSNCV
jgi:hypothetical protein